MVKSINDENFAEEVNSNEIVLVDFYATWCPPCKALASVLEDISNSRKYKILKINVDENPVHTYKFKINVVPTLILFRGGKPVETSVGYIEKEEIINLMDKHID